MKCNYCPNYVCVTANRRTELLPMLRLVTHQFPLRCRARGACVNMETGSQRFWEVYHNHHAHHLHASPLLSGKELCLMVIAAGQCLQLLININLISRKINCSADIYVIVCSHSNSHTSVSFLSRHFETKIQKLNKSDQFESEIVCVAQTQTQAG